MKKAEGRKLKAESPRRNLMRVLSARCERAVENELVEAKCAVWNAEHQLHGRGLLIPAIGHAQTARQHLDKAEMILRLMGAYPQGGAS